MDKLQLVASLFVLVLTALIGAITGSMRAIRPEWHKEPIWSHCIRRKSLLVSQVSGFVLGLGSFFGYIAGSGHLIFWIGNDHLGIRFLVFLAFVFATYFIARFVVWVVGTLIYGDAVRREGYNGRAKGQRVDSK